ncbi:MAG: hypothetical protein IPM34_13450 [Saprospiraceae bacterium]|nr:hypothetical protein [Saprospiraceae bacterium]
MRIKFCCPPDPFTTDPMIDVKSVGANWVSFIPYGFSSQHHPEVRFANLHWQWWGEKPEGIRQCIRLAKKSGIHIMLKPQVYIHGSWVGAIDFQTENEWQVWEKSYTEYLMMYVRMAKDENVPLLCIATEYDKAAIKRETFFRNLIIEIRKIYQGKLVYSANWDQFQNIPFWDALDYVGISAYFPLSEGRNPGLADLKQAWDPYLKLLEDFSEKIQKPILFTEFGYLSVDGSAGKTWEVEKIMQSIPVNEMVQANAYQALFSSLWEKPWWAGGFLWKWFPEGKGHEGFPEKDYTPQGKKAEAVLRNWYQGNRD